MRNKWVISDMHFGHSNIIKFVRDNESPVRPIPGTSTFFNNIQEHDELIVDNWNKNVRPNDAIYILGDIGKPIDIMNRLNGKKRIILGNHDDIHTPNELAQHFEKVLSWRFWKNEFAHPTIFCHYPLHANETLLSKRRILVHGHTHDRQIHVQNQKILDPWYVNVCVEHTKMAPLAFEDLAVIIKSRIATINHMFGDILKSQQ